MKISDVFSAKGLKLKLCYQDNSNHFTLGALISIVSSQKENEFLVGSFGAGVNSNEMKPAICKTDSSSSQYIKDLLETEKSGSVRCLFSIEGINEDSIEVQAYIFNSIKTFKTTVQIIIPEKLLDKTPDKLREEYTWDQLGEPAVFCLNYKSRKKQNADLRFLSGKRYLLAHNTVRGIIAESENYLRDKDYLPIDVIVAPSIRFIPASENAGENNDLAAYLDRVASPQSYFTRWEAYNELSKKLIEQQSEEFGELKYTSYTMETDLVGITFKFTTNEKVDDSVLGKELGVGKSSDPYDTGDGKVKKQTAVGKIRKISGYDITTYLEIAEGYDTIPERGSLELYIAGDKSIMARRDAARERMIKHQSPIKSIVALIEAGASSCDWGSYKPITDELKRNLTKAIDFNPEQIKAIEIAINTPDIALIQGPPGTGKTTVIKAICERFREIYEAEERVHKKMDPERSLRSPKILISSFQNEAVDNAISAPLPGDIPAYRKTAKRAKDSMKEQYQKSLDNWYIGVCNSINDLIQDKAAAEFVQARNLLCDEYLSYKNSGENLELAAKLIKHYLSFSEICYPAELIDAANSVIRATNNDDVANDFPDPIVAKLESQRLDAEAFSDDGAINAKRLVAHLKTRDDLDIDDNVLDTISAVCSDQVDEDTFSLFVATVEKLKKKYCKHSVTIDVKNQGVVNECLMALAENFNTQYRNTLTDIESKKSLILSEFLSRLEQEYETIVRKYSMTTAATCQTSLDLRKDSNEVFDLVVIDEAARANPLDLFIPMSMGKKIVLVGDHKQLPHMLEPDVLRAIKDDPKFRDLPEIEKSLFERLFEMFSKGHKPKAILLTHQFRMHPEICKFVSEAFYEDQIKTSDRISADLRSSPKEINDGRALTFVNVRFAKGSETAGVSKSREIEVEAVSKEIRRILAIDSRASVGIITFYAAQAAKIKQRLDMTLNNEEITQVEVGTVDAFQGKEFDYVLLSCVRANTIRAEAGMTEIEKENCLRRSVGFMTKPNRLCVAFSRARRQLILFGDAETLIQIPCFARLHDICLEGGGCYHEY